MPATRTYANDDIIVYWYPELCIHVRHCANILPEVFRPDKRPWVNLEGGTAREIVLTIDRCPSGALRYTLPEGSSVHPVAADGPGRQREAEGTEGQAAVPASSPSGTAAPVKMTVMPNGPLLTEGPVEVSVTDGRVIARAGRLSLCRCGLSANKPFCDGAHKREGWKADRE
ncbi:MAG: (4Fe-4S)-binding protein [Bacillota bacterium]|nr:(4Fe-4S)-binding protein [Bacillota bacterium]